jgi:dehydrogenase/reductase SDR family protein 7B
MNNDFLDKVVWITGASSGIGEALAYAFAPLGAKMVLSARNADRLEEVRLQCGTASENILVLPLDITDREAIRKAVDQVIHYFGRIDYMVHNAGIAARDRVEKTDMAVFRRVMETNFFGTVELTKALFPVMRDQGSGHLVVILSLSAIFGAPLLSAYASSKHALVGFFESLRAESGNEHIHIHLIVPGFINTPILMHAIDGDGKVKGENLSINEKGMSPEECASLMIKAIRKERDWAMIGSSAKISVVLHRFFPAVFRKLIRSNPIKRIRRIFPRAFR